jgi:hypothetical protein
MTPEPEYPFIFTPPMKKRLSKRLLKMLHDAWRHFPELRDRKITVGYTSAHLGSAVVPLRADRTAKLTIRLKVRRLTYNTLGHELTHLLQGLSKARLNRGKPRGGGRIPWGEKQCDIWTLARSSLFCDDAPTYLKLPRAVRENWPAYAQSVRKLCITALEKRKSHRLYMRWLELQIKDLARRPVSMAKAGNQLPLPFS